MTNTTDTTPRTLSQARRMPQWQRLIDSVHLAQAAQGFDGRQFDAKAVEFFRATLIGKPIEQVGAAADDFSVYWVERQELEHTDSASVRYVVKMVRGDNLAKVETVSDEILESPTADEDRHAALEFIQRARKLAGKF